MTPAPWRGDVAGLQRRGRRQAGLGRARLRARRSTPSCGPRRRPSLRGRSRWSSAITGRASRAAARGWPSCRRGAGRRAVPRGAGGAAGPRAAAGRRATRAGARATDHVGVFRQRRPGLNYVGLKTPVGRVTGDQLLELARLAERVRPRRAAADAAAERPAPARARPPAGRPHAGAAAARAAATTRRRSSAGSSRARARTSATWRSSTPRRARWRWRASSRRGSARRGPSPCAGRAAPPRAATTTRPTSACRAAR